MSKLTDFEEAILMTIKGQPYEDQGRFVNYRCNGVEKIGAAHLAIKGYLKQTDNDGRYFKVTDKGKNYKWNTKAKWEK